MYEEDIEIEAEDSGEPPAWMLTFADLVSLLICFFVLLYSMKSVDESIWKKISGSFAGALNYSQKFKEVTPNSDSGVEAEKILNSDGMEYIQSILMTKFEKEGLLELVRFSRSEVDNSLHVHIPASHMFVGDSQEITKRGEKVLTFLTETIQYIDDSLEIASYTAHDEQGLSIQKSMLRSLAVRDFILRKGADKAIKVFGFGSAQYDEMKDIMLPAELESQTVKLEFIIRSAK
jgi:flagellar motor protein MotB